MAGSNIAWQKADKEQGILLSLLICIAGNYVLNVRLHFKTAGQKNPT
jgi:hypothetical protein